MITAKYRMEQPGTPEGCAVATIVDDDGAPIVRLSHVTGRRGEYTTVPVFATEVAQEIVEALNLRNAILTLSGAKSA
jgi:hypothetical protein